MLIKKFHVKQLSNTGAFLKINRILKKLNLVYYYPKQIYRENNSALTFQTMLCYISYRGASMKKLFFFLVLGICGLMLFAQSGPATFKVLSYQISRAQTANRYTKAELIIDDETRSWEIILYRKDNTNPERIKLEQSEEFNKSAGVFRTVTIQETAGTSGSNLFAYIPAFVGNKIQIDFCDKRTEGVKRRLILEF